MVQPPTSLSPSPRRVGAASFAYETSAVSSTVGAAVGGTVLAPLGPAGVGEEVMDMIQ